MPTSGFRLPIAGAQGSRALAFYCLFRPGAVHKKHYHQNCDEMTCIVNGNGVSCAGSDLSEIRAGHFHLIPQGETHWACHLEGEAPVEVIGIYAGAGSAAETAYVYAGDVTDADLGPFAGRRGLSR